MATNRRDFIVTMAQNIGLCALGGFIWTGYLDGAKAAPLTLRPPGAKKESEFMKSCIKCGLCVEACPYDTLKLAKPGDKIPFGTPFFTPREIPCYMCTDIPCVPVCPTGALDEKLVTTKNELDIEKATMGTAMVDSASCIAFWGIQCDACYRACPLLDNAISLEYRKNERTGKHAFLIPVVNSETCTGCGLCEHACVVKKAAIFVRPQELAKGDVGDYYVKGWDEKDQKRVNDAKEIRSNVKKKSATDYLNEGISYE